MTEQQDDGFSLIELLLVIVILGILGAAVAFAVGGFSSDAEESACAADSYTLATAAEAYFAQHAAVVIPPAASDTSSNTYETTLMEGGFLRGHSEHHDLDAMGRLVGVLGSPCTV